MVMDAVTDLIGILAQVTGPAFVPHFDILFPNLMHFATGQRVHSDRSMAIGCFAEVIAEIGPAAEKYAELLLPLIAMGLKDEMESVRRNSAFCMATFVDAAGSALGGHFLQILECLRPLCTRAANQQSADSGGADVDNALSAVAKMIKAAPERVPLEHVIPVMLAALPLRADYSEGPSVYGSLSALILANNPVVLANLPSLLSSLGQELVASKTVDETKGIIFSTLQAMKNSPTLQPLLLTALSSAFTEDSPARFAINQALQ